MKKPRLTRKKLVQLAKKMFSEAAEYYIMEADEKTIRKFKKGKYTLQVNLKMCGQ